jgi:septal ring-binding cell division protein DamX
MQSHYGLKHDPFGVINDSMVFSGAGGRYETAETIRHLLSYSHQDSFLIGPAGAGKRTLAQQVLKLIDDQWRVAWIDGSDIENTTDLAKELVGQLGLGIKIESATGDLIAQINQVVAKRYQDEESFLVVVQFAERLPGAVVEALLSVRLEAADLDTRVRQLWLAETTETLFEKLNEEDWYLHELHSFDPEDADQYLKDRLVSAGYVDELPIDHKDVARLNQIAEGLPGSLNEVARDYLISATFRTTEKKQSFPITHVIAGVAALSLVAIAFLYQRNDQQAESTEVSLMDKPTEEMTSVEKRLAEAVAKVEAKQNLDTESAPTETLALEPIESDAQALPVVEALPVTQPESAVQADALVENGTATSDESEALPDNSASRLLQRGRDSQFTMQLIGVRERAKLDDIIADFPDAQNVDVIETTHQDKPWFVLIYGEFETKEAAQAAVSSLPESLKDAQPWIRSFASLR